MGTSMGVLESAENKLTVEHLVTMYVLSSCHSWMMCGLLDNREDKRDGAKGAQGTEAAVLTLASVSRGTAPARICCELTEHRLLTRAILTAD